MGPEAPARVQTATAVSAPGKVLLTGGYLVLDRNFRGAVYALDARIHVVVRQLHKGAAPENGTGAGTAGTSPDAAEKADGKSQEGNEEVIIVRSPQFKGAEWTYKVTTAPDGGGVRVVQQGDDRPNKFVETSLNYALTYISYVAASSQFGSLSITILADNDYYSETETAQIREGTPFKDFGVALHDAHKTGLGSSAALVTALVSALVIHRTVRPEGLPSMRAKLHNLAQAAHCAAQGKVGSGFDVAAAVYGTCLYRRFSPSVLEGLGDAGSPKFEDRLFAVVEDLNKETPWDAQCIDFGTKLPRGMQMVLCDVDCGSETPGMVKKVLQWRENNRDSVDQLWTDLQRNNEKLRLELRRLSHARDEVIDFESVRQLIFQSRNLIRIMTKQSGVPIEPSVQTELLDRVSELDGVVGGVVPGAGGYDAIALLIYDDSDVIQSLIKFFETYTSKVEDDFGGKIGKVRLLGVRHGSEGVRNETGAQYSGWL